MEKTIPDVQPTQPDECDKDNGSVGVSTKEAPAKICPISGWAVQRQPEWTDVAFEQGFTITAEIIGNDILLTHNHGRATIEGVRKAFEFTDAIIDQHLAQRPYIHILDYSYLGGTTLEGRRYFIQHMLQRQQLVGVIFYGLSPLLRMSTKLGKRLNIIQFDVHIAQDYQGAVFLARELLEAVPGHAIDDKTPSAPFTDTYLSHDGTHHTILRRDDWIFEQEGFSVRYEVIDGHIMHAISEGCLEVAHLPGLIALREHVYNSLTEPHGPHYILADLQGLQRVGRRSRKYYQDAMLTWHRKVPIRGYIVYGVNPFTAAVTNFSRFILPFPVKATGDLDSALGMVREETEAAGGNGHREGAASLVSGSHSSAAADPVEHLLEYIGSIDWERDGLSLTKDVGENSSLSPVYDAISVIKSELDDLLQEKIKAETALKAARDDLDARVRERTAELIATNQRLQAEIAERREMEAALRASEKNYRDLVHSVNSIILRWDAEGKIVFMNPYGLTFFGYEAEELIGGNVVGTIVPESESISQRDLKDLMLAIRQDPDRFRNNENENITRDGRRVWVYWTNRAITDADGRIVEILSVGNDITGRRREIDAGASVSENSPIVVVGHEREKVIKAFSDKEIRWRQYSVADNPAAALVAKWRAVAASETYLVD